MFVGHFAVGLASKSAAPRLSLATTFVACQLLDLVWPVLVLVGVERVRVDHGATAFTPLDFEYYPWSHSLAASVVLSLAAFAILKALKHTHVEAAVVAAAVLSHWVLDLLTHRPDLPLGFGDTAKVGLGLWGSITGTMMVELGLFAAGTWLYVRKTRASNKKGVWAFWTLIAFLLLAYFANALGPKPPIDAPAAAIAGPALAFWLLVAWAYWADKNRTARQE